MKTPEEMRAYNNEKARRWRKNNPKRSSESWQRYYLSPTGTVTMLLNGAKDRAKRLDIPFDLDRDFVAKLLEETTVCPLSGMELVREYRGDYRAHHLTPSLDRIDGKQGYVKGNVRIVSFWANRVRSEWGDEVFIDMCKAVALQNGE